MHTIRERPFAFLSSLNLLLWEMAICTPMELYTLMLGSTLVGVSAPQIMPVSMVNTFFSVSIAGLRSVPLG